MKRTFPVYVARRVRVARDMTVLHLRSRTRSRLRVKRHEHEVTIDTRPPAATWCLCKGFAFRDTCTGVETARRLTA